VAIHGQSAEASADPLGPRWRTVVPIETPFPDVDPGEALRRAGRITSWRAEALDSLRHWHDAWTKAVNASIRAQDDRQFLADWTTRFQAGDAREAGQFETWRQDAVRAGNLERQLAVIAEVPYPPPWLQRYAAYVRRYRTKAEAAQPDRLRITTSDDGHRTHRFADTGTFFYEERP
jgi:hypothetical protein